MALPVPAVAWTVTGPATVPETAAVATPDRLAVTVPSPVTTPVPADLLKMTAWLGTGLVKASVTVAVSVRAVGR